MSDLVVRLGERLRLMRKDRGLSQERLGELAGLHTNYIGQVERGEKNLTVETLEKIALGLNVSMEEIFRYIHPAKSNDVLGKINDILASRSTSDREMALAILKQVFQWETDKYS